MMIKKIIQSVDSKLCIISTPTTPIEIQKTMFSKCEKFNDKLKLKCECAQIYAFTHIMIDDFDMKTF